MSCVIESHFNRAYFEGRKGRFRILLERRQLRKDVGETNSVRMAQTVQRMRRFIGERMHTTEIFIERGMQSLSCDTRTPKNKAANGFVCIQRIRTNQVQLNRSRRRKRCGRSLSLTCESEPCAFFQTCATRTSRQPKFILRSITMTPNSTLRSMGQ